LEYKNKAHEQFKTVVEIIGSKWNLFIIYNLRDQTLRFSALQKSMGEVNSKTVTKHLRELEENKIIKRVVYAEVPPRVEYSLTEKGKAFLPVFDAIRDCAEHISET
jgi:DNA-binding HxlR family transcriptional regulator